MIDSFAKTLFFLLILPFFAIAQKYVPPCATYGDEGEMVFKRLQENKTFLKQNPIFSRNATIFVPVKFHLVARNDGTGRVKERDVLDQLCAINEDFSEMDIQFYIKDGFNYINNTAVYNTHANTINTIMNFNRVQGALNIFIVNDASPSEDGLGTTLGYFTSFRDWVVMRRDNVGDSFSVLSHEIGHFFSLPHPHRGWDAEPWDSKKHGCPVKTISPGNIATEKMDGSNCEEAGDGICDTPPDYNGFGWPNCNFDGGACDPDTVLIDPMETNFMGYFLNCRLDDYRFTAQQKDIMVADATRSRTSGRFSASDPSNANSIAKAPVLLSPADGASVNPASVTFQWEAVEGADSYLFELSLTDITFNSSALITQLVADSKVTITNLQLDRGYFWRVKPFNEYYACQNFSTTNRVLTRLSTKVHSIPEIDQVQIQPNSVLNGDIQLFAKVSNPIRASISLFDLTGKIVNHFGEKSFQSGENQFNFSVGSLHSGVYMLNIKTEGGTITQKVVLLE